MVASGKRTAQIILPSSPIRPGAERERFDAGVTWLGQHLEVIAPVHDHNHNHGVAARDTAVLPWLAGEDRSRARQLAEAHADCVWMGRGGAGAARTLAVFDRHEPIELWGFSDGTTLLAEWCRRGWSCWSAPPLTQIPRLDGASIDRLVRALRGEVPAFDGLTTIVPGYAAGPLAGGNLAVLSSLVGTPHMPRLRDAIVVLEDVGEVAYRVDRMLHQLLFSGAFEGVAGIVLGAFIGISEAEVALVRRCLEVFFEALGLPCAMDLPFGHGESNAALPMGVPFELHDGRLARL